MARLRFPDSASIDRVQATANTSLLSAAGATARVYVDAAGTQLADIQNGDGTANATATLTLDSLSRLPEFLGPTSGTDVLYVRVDGGGPLAVEAQLSQRFAAQDAAVASDLATFKTDERAFASSTYETKTGATTARTSLRQTVTAVHPAAETTGRLGDEQFVYAFVHMGGGVVLAATFPNGAVYRSTDYGLTWTLVVKNAGGAATLHDLLHVGSGRVLGATDNAGKVAISTDSGLTWTNSAASPQVNSVLSNPKVNCFALLDNGVVLAGIFHNSVGGGKIHRSTDAGATWDAGRSLGNAKGVDIILDFGGGVVLAGSQESGDGLSEWWRSTDFGVTFSRVSDGLNVSASEFGHAGVVTGPNTAVVGTYGGGLPSHLYRTTDGGLTFTLVDTDNAEGFFAVANVGNGVLLAGTGISTAKAKIKASYDGGLSWADYQFVGTTGISYAVSLLPLPAGVVLAGTGGNGGDGLGEVWRIGGTRPAAASQTRVLVVTNRSGAPFQAGTPVILGGLPGTVPASGAVASGFFSSNNGDASTLGVALEPIGIGVNGKVISSGIATVKVIAGDYSPGDLLKTHPDGQNAQKDNALNPLHQLGKVLVGGTAVTTVTALITAG